MQQTVSELPTKSEEWSDDDLLARAKAGELFCVAELFKRSRRTLLFCLKGILPNREDREDALQGGLVKVLKSLNEFKEGNNTAKAWVMKIVSNHARDIQRKQLGRWTRKVQWIANLDVEAPGEHTDPAIQAADHEERELISRWLATQSPDVRQVFDLRFGEGKTFSEISQELGFSTTTAYRLVNQGLVTLRSSLLA